ncbi:phosphotransferase [Microbacterium phyllosphaerae]|uniref:phosphotransferase n=1 Tax=Microbacterium phyllosphaerae TaxID=124798 RepID=UPI003D650CE4
MHEGELALTDETAGRLIARRFPEFGLMPLRRVPTAGTVNTIFRIGDELAVRFPLTGESEAALIAEADAMSEFAVVCPVAAPRPVGIGTASPDYPSAWSAQTWVPGETARHDHHATSDSPAFDVAALIAALRATDVRVDAGCGVGAAAGYRARLILRGLQPRHERPRAVDHATAARRHRALIPRVTPRRVAPRRSRP